MGSMGRFLFALVLLAGMSLTPALAQAGTTYKTSLVPNVADTTPGFSARGSKILLRDQLVLKGAIKGVVDVGGNRRTTDSGVAGDEYSVEVDLFVPATVQSGTVTIPFDLKNGNGKFRLDLTGDPILAGAEPGDGITVLGVRVKDDLGAEIGTGGIALR
jgi:hypothetical protein